MKMALNERPFFGKKGGITFSGGEPTLQAEALLPLFRMLKDKNIHICLDTNGGVWNPAVEDLLSLTDLVLLDVKEFNPERHRALTGRDNYTTLRFAAWLEEHSKPFWLRYVLVPGYSDFEEDIRALGAHFGQVAAVRSADSGTDRSPVSPAKVPYRMLQRVEILPYHTLGVHKYSALGQEYALKDVPLNTPEQLVRAKSIFSEYFPSVIIN